MKILWVCNIMLPLIAEHLHMPASNKEGWLTGLSNRILEGQRRSGIELGVCFPAEGEFAEFGQAIRVTLHENECDEAVISAFGFPEDVSRPEIYDERTQERLERILRQYKPDIVHCFGTEYSHTLAAVRAFHRPDRTLIGIQGLCAVYAEHYRADLPERVWNRATFRDRLKRDDLKHGQEVCRLRGVHEIEAVKQVRHVTGRTHWDRHYTGEWNPNAEYHFMNETLRSNFYRDCWNYDACRKHSIFLSQGDYPIKGLHYMIQAMPEILKVFPDAAIYVAGNSIIKGADGKGAAALKGKLKLDSYGAYILQLMKETNTLDRVHFLGRLSAEEMKKQYLRSHVFVCPSSIENSPNSVGEAMILGMPVVSAEVGGISSIFEDGRDGILYPSGDVGALSAAVIRMMGDEEFRSGCCASARAHARKTHDANVNFERLLEIYDELMKGNGVNG